MQGVAAGLHVQPHALAAVTVAGRIRAPWKLLPVLGAPPSPPPHQGARVHVSLEDSPDSKITEYNNSEYKTTNEAASNSFLGFLERALGYGHLAIIIHGQTVMEIKNCDGGGGGGKSCARY